MAEVIDLRSRRAKRPGGGARFVHCAYCGERHPIVRLEDGSESCPTAFADGTLWFCRNRGCRSAYFSPRRPRS